MPHDRFFVDSPFLVKEHLSLQDEARHIKVMRIRAGEEIELVNGRSQIAQACLLDPQTAEILSVEERKPPSPLILCQAVPRLSRLDTIVEKGTELGMTELWLFPGKQSEKKELSPAQLKRVKQITIAAMKQCGRLDLPGIKLKPPISQWDRLDGPAYFGDIGEQAPPLLSILEKKGRVHFIVGPEAGFTPDEEARLKTLGIQGVKLHPWILRTDTASIAALSLIAYTILN